jgi:hypothetical protein
VELGVTTGQPAVAALRPDHGDWCRAATQEL